MGPRNPNPGPASDPNETTDGPVSDEFVDPTATMDGPTQAPTLDPERLGRFRIVGRVGEGAMGVVYEAIDEFHGHRVALKAMHRLGPERLYRFKREFRSLTGLSHPNVVALHELFAERDTLFFTMELVAGCDFVTAVCGPANRSRRHSPCRDFDRLRAVMRELAAGVHAIHQAGILHRDIKPSNVLVTREGRVVLLDFGLVREHGVDDHIGVTADGALLGTPLYMAPEQIAGTTLGPGADWYAVGELLYHVLTGAPAFADLGMLGMLTAKRDGRPPPPSGVVAGIPADLEALCMELLDPEPRARPDGEAIVARLGAPRSTANRERALFLGRAAEIAQLAEAFKAAESAPVLVLVEGASGIGKTAMVTHFLDPLAARADTVVLSGRCSERESIPYKALDPIIDALTLRLGVHTPPEAVEAVLPRDVDSIARLFPVLRGVPAVALAAGRRELEADPVTARRRAFAALAELLGRLGDRRRLAIYIDDFQWADHDSAVLLGGVLGHPDPPAVLVILAVRDAEARNGTPLQRLLAELAERDRPLTTVRISLGALPLAQAEELAGELLGSRSRPARNLIKEIVREAEGSPFFVGELVRYARLVDSGDAARDADVNLGNVIRHRLRRLPEAARCVLDVVAVAGGRFRQGQALEIGAALRPAATVDPGVLNRLVVERLVRLDGHRPRDMVEIDHDRIRKAVIEEIDPSLLPSLHLTIATKLAESGEADEPALAHHFRAAGELRLAHDHTLAAAEQAETALAFDRAAELYRMALAGDTSKPDELGAIEARLAAALANGGRAREAAAAYRRAAAHGGNDRVEWLRQAAEILLASGHTDEGRAALDEVLRTVDLSLPRGTASALARLVGHRAAIAVAGIAERPHTDTSPEALARLDVCWTASRGLIYTDALLGAAFHAQHLRLAARVAEPARLARALAAEAHFTVAVGSDAKLPAAMALLTRAQALADASGSEYASGMIAEASGNIALVTGQWERSFAELERAIAVFRGLCTGVSHEIAICRAHGALALQFMGRVQLLRERAYALLDDTRDRPNPYVSGFARGILGNMASLASDRVEEAAEQLAIYQHDAPRRFEAHIINYTCQIAALERYRGRPERAWAMAQRDEPTIARLGIMRTPYAASEAALWQAQCALAGATILNDAGPALAVARRTIARLERQQSSHVRAYAAMCRASLLALAGRDREAVEALRAAVAVFASARMLAFEASTLRRLAALVGGDEGTILRAESDAKMATMGVLRPEAFTDMMAPGFVRQPSNAV